MARYFFDLLSPREVCADETGTELPDAETAYLEACEAALEMGVEMLRNRQDPVGHSFEIRNAEGTVLFQVPFTEVMRPALHVAPMDKLHANLHRNVERSSKALSELKTTFGRTKSLLEDARALLNS